MTRVLRIRSGKLSSAAPGGRIATLGSFDGIHLGHRKVLEHVRHRAVATGTRSALITFVPHPSVALGKAVLLPVLTTLRQKCNILTQLGIDELILIRFNREVFELTYEKFISDYLLSLLQVTSLVIGPDARVGRGGEGTSEKIIGYLERSGGAGEIVNFQTDDQGRKIGSRAIRDLITTGDVSDARSLLGRNYQLCARVVRGDGRGEGIGFPTANLHIQHEVVPKNGVYAGYALIDNQQLPAVANIGVRPTFSGIERRVEIHILDMKRELYGARLTFDFVARLRDELKFDSIEALQTQIREDITRARNLLLHDRSRA